MKTLILWSLLGAGVAVQASAHDCPMAERYRALAREKIDAAAPEQAVGLLRRAAEACPSYDAYEQLAELGASLPGTDDDLKDTAAAFAAAHARAGSNDERAHTLHRYALFLDGVGAPQVAYRYAMAAKGLKPADPEIAALAAKVGKEFAGSSPQNIQRSVHLTSLLPELVVALPPSAAAGPRSTHSAAPHAAAASARSIDIPIHFVSGTVEVEAEMKANIEALAHAIADPAMAKARFLFVGHCDVRGSEAVNEPLSLRRAATLRDLVEGLEPGLKGRIAVEGHGSREPIDPGADDAAMAANRRLQVLIRK